jgi:hypothetical protein
MTTSTLTRFDLVTWKIERLLEWRSTWTDADADQYDQLVAEETSLMLLRVA